MVEQQYKKVHEINRLNALVNIKISLSFVRKHLYSIKDIIAVSRAGRSIIGWGGGAIFIYSCSAQLISFEIVIYILKSFVFTVCEHEYMNVAPPPPQLSIFRRCKKDQVCCLKDGTDGVVSTASTTTSNPLPTLYCYDISGSNDRGG